MFLNRSRTISLVVDYLVEDVLPDLLTERAVDI
jgi:hypothetical protein